MASDVERNIVIYTPKKGQEDALRQLVEQHGPAIRASGLAADEPVRLFHARDVRTGVDSFVEMFAWRDREASGVAHQTPEVMAVWEPMDALLEHMTILRVEPLEADD